MTIIAPAGVSANVMLVNGRISRLVSKALKGTTRRLVVTLPTGRAAVRVWDVVQDGKVYSPGSVRPRLMVRAARKSALRVRFRALPVADDLHATSIVTNTVTLGWSAKKGAIVALRRAVGGSAPATVRAGVPVRVSGKSVTDSGLRPGTQYSYALFTKVKGRWSPPVTMTVGTASPAGSSVASYVAPPSTVIVRPGNADIPSVANGVVSVELASGQPTPVMGAGFVLPISRTLPGGFLGKVVNVSADGRSVRLAPAGLADVFDDYSVNANLGDSGTRKLQPAARSGRTLGHSDTKGEPLCADTGSRSASLNATVGWSGSFKASLVTKLFVPVGAKFSLGAQAQIGIDPKITASGSLTCSLPFDPVVYTITADPVPISLVFTPTAQITTSGAVVVQGLGASASLGVEADAEIGLHNSLHSDLTHNASVTTPSLQLSSSVDGVLSGQFTLGPGAGTDVAGAIAGVSGTLSPAHLRLDASNAPDATGNCHLSTVLGGDASLGLNAQAWAGSLGVSKTLTLLSKSWQYYGSDSVIPCIGSNTPTSPGAVTVTNPGAQASRLGGHITLPISANDSNGEALTYAASDLPPGASIDPTTGLISGTVTADGQMTATVTATDADGASDAASFVWTVSGAAPCSAGAGVAFLDTTPNGDSTDPAAGSFDFPIDEVCIGSDQIYSLANPLEDGDGDITSLAWSPDGSSLAYAEGEPNSDFGIYTLDVQTGTVTTVESHTNGEQDDQPGWSPDGQTMVFGRGAYYVGAPSEDQQDNGLWSVAAAGGAPHQLTGCEASGPSWSPDGTKIAFANSGGMCFDPGGSFSYVPSGIYTIKPDGTDQTIVYDGTDTGAPVEQPLGAAWSPDGTKIAFWGYQTGGVSNIFTMNPDGSDLVNVTGALTSEDAACGASARQASWSPDSSRIVFEYATSNSGTACASGASNGDQIATIEPDGAGFTVIATGDYDMPTWQP